eukprot:jgi/Chlat1/8671/Chrsp88S08059
MADSCLAACAASGASKACFDACYTSAGWSEPVSPKYYNIPVAIFLIMMSAMFAGLTLGLMSLDKVGLQIIMEGGDKKERKWAAAIRPIRERGNLLLCTLLLGNAFVNSFAAILLAELTSGWLGLVLSTSMILIFGEIIPQAICSRHGLQVGAKAVWIVRFFLVLFYPVAWPLSLLLDKALGYEIGNVYSKEELIKLIAIHVENPDAQQESGLTKDDHALITGALVYKNKKVQDVMTAIDNAFMLEQSQRLDFETLFQIYKSGFTRIPVYDTTPHNMVGLLYAKDLILVDPDDEIEVRAILSFHGREVRTVPEDTSLGEVFKEFKTSYIHLVFATRAVTPAAIEELEGETDKTSADEQGGSPKTGHAAYEITGLITLEDVIEEVIQEEIVDESDNFVDVNYPAHRIARPKQDVSFFLNMLQHKRKLSDALSVQEIEVITNHLSFNVKAFKVMSRAPGVVKSLVRRATLVDRFNEGESDDEDEHGYSIYERGKPADFFTLILQGKASTAVAIEAGADGFESDSGPWSVLAQNALLPDTYVPDFTARMYGAGRLLQIHRVNYQAAWRAVQASYVNKGVGRAQSATDLTTFGSTLKGAAPTLVLTPAVTEAPALLGKPSNVPLASPAFLPREDELKPKQSSIVVRKRQVSRSEFPTSEAAAPVHPVGSAAQTDQQQPSSDLRATDTGETEMVHEGPSTRM